MLYKMLVITEFNHQQNFYNNTEMETKLYLQ